MLCVESGCRYTGRDVRNKVNGCMDACGCACACLCGGVTKEKDTDIDTISFVYITQVLG